MKQQKTNNAQGAPRASETDRPPSLSPVGAPSGAPPKAGRYGFLLIGLFVAGVAVWLFARVSTTVTANKAIEEQRKGGPVVASNVVEVSLASLTRARWGATVPIEGTVEAKDRAELAFKVGGRLATVDVRVGDQVRAGQALGRLDALEASAQVRAAEAQLEAARAQTALAEDQGRRTSTLVATGALAEATGVQAIQAQALSQAQAKAAAAQLSLAQASLSNHGLVAPFSGVVTKAPTTRGAVVLPGQPLFEVVDNTALRLKGTVNEADAGLVTVGAPVIVQTDGGPARGKVRVIVQVLDRVTRRVPVEVDLEPHSGLRVGGFVRASIQGAGELDVISVPGSALRPGSQDTVMLVNSDRLEERQVRFAVDPTTGSLLVRSGLLGDEKVVLAPRPEAAAGDLVKIVPGPSSSTAPKAAAPAAQAKKE